MGDPRTAEQIREHYEIERELADRLRHGTREERRRLYTEVYDELFRRVPLHPQLQKKAAPEDRRRVVRRKLRLLGHYLRPGLRFMELGPGDCALALTVAGSAAAVTAVDVSPDITAGFTPPDNFTLCISDGASVPVPAGSVDLAFSDQLMEHLHPDDAREQLAGVFAALAPGGAYVCITPSRLSGPHDVSQHFDGEATGLHLKEYTIAELVGLFRQVGFDRFHLYAGGKGWYVRIPLWLGLWKEAVAARLPARRALARFLPVRAVLGINLVGFRPR
jgi:SAM-dependent methyltransferase